MKYTFIIVFIASFYSNVTKSQIQIDAPSTYTGFINTGKARFTLSPANKYNFSFDNYATLFQDSGHYEIAKNGIVLRSSLKSTKIQIDTTIGVYQYCFDLKEPDTAKIVIKNNTTYNLSNIYLLNSSLGTNNFSLKSKDSKIIVIPLYTKCGQTNITLIVGGKSREMGLYKNMELTINIDTSFVFKPMILKIKVKKQKLKCTMVNNQKVLLTK